MTELLCICADLIAGKGLQTLEPAAIHRHETLGEDYSYGYQVK